MGAARKLKMTKEFEYIERGIREGWIVTQYVSNRRLIVDRRFQARAIEETAMDPHAGEALVDMDHVRLLGRIRDAKPDAPPLHPIMTYLITIKGQAFYIVADGIHRATESRMRGDADILAYVATVDNPEYEARFFATMCNQMTLKPRTADCLRKAVAMLCEVEEYRRWTSRLLAEHIGGDITPKTANKYRLEYLARQRMDIPTEILPSSKAKAKPRVKHRPSGSRDSGPFRIAGNSSLVLRPGDGEEPEHGASILVNTQRFRAWALTQGVALDSLGRIPSGFRLAGFVKGDRVIVLCPSLEVEHLYETIGRVLITCRLVGKVRAIVVAKEPDRSERRRIMDEAGFHNVEFLTPARLIQDIKRADGDTSR